MIYGSGLTQVDWTGDIDVLNDEIKEDANDENEGFSMSLFDDFGDDINDDLEGVKPNHDDIKEDVYAELNKSENIDEITDKDVVHHKNHKRQSKKKKLKRQSLKKSNSESATNQPVRKRQRGHHLDEAEVLSYIRLYLSDLSAAVDADEVALSSGLPATSRLALLPDMIHKVAAPKWTMWFLNEGICNMLGRWLAPLADGSLPNLTIRSEILKLLLKLPIHTDHLQGNSLGKRLIHLYKSKDETEDNRRLIHQLLNNVLRPILGIRSCYKAIRENEDNERVPNDAKMEIDEDRELKALEMQYDESIQKYKRARVPINTGFEFKVLPKSTVDIKPPESTSRDHEGTLKRLSRLMINKKHVRQRPSQAVRVSISKSTN